MAKLNVALPDGMKRWVDDQTQTGRYSNSDDYIQDLIRRDQERLIDIAQFQAMVAEGLSSGPSDESMADILTSLKSEITRHP